MDKRPTKPGGRQTAEKLRNSGVPKEEKVEVEEELEEGVGECELAMCCAAGLILLLLGAVVVIAVAPAARPHNKVLPRTQFPSNVKTKTAFEVRPFSSEAVEKALFSEYELESHMIDCTSLSKQEKQSKSPEMDLLVLVHSNPQTASEVRNRLRMSWMKELPPGVEAVFVVPAKGISQGDTNKLREECQNYRDMVVFLDGPSRPESEFFLLQLAWVSMRHVNFKYMLKTRDNMYVNLPRMMTDLIQELKQNQSNAYLGYFKADQKVRPKKGTKLPMQYEPNWVLCDKFIRFAHPGGYILSYKLVLRLHSLSFYLYPYNNEHIALATWLSPYKDVDWHHDIRFNTEEGRSRGCRNDWLVFQSSNPLTMHQKLQSSGMPCGDIQWEESQTYSFNFNVAPSNCCTRVVFK